MKRYTRAAMAAAMAVVLVGMLSGTAEAANRWWDGGTGDIVTDGNGLSGGTAGNWDTTLKNWDAGAVAHVAWVNANNDTAIFGGTAGTVTLTAPVTVGGLRFDTTGYTLTSDALTFGAANNSIILGSIPAATRTGTVGGSGNVTVTAANPATAGTLTLNGTSTGGWSGTTTINPGLTLSLSGLNQGLVSTTGGITLNGGGITLVNTSAGEAALDRVKNDAAITANSGTITFQNTSGTTTYAETIGAVALSGGQLNIVEGTDQNGTGSQTLTLSGLTQSGSAVVTFSSTDTRTTKNIIVVSGATATPANQIIGPWATIGATAAAQTDYAIYNGSAQVVDANIAATAENSGSWVSGANVTLSGATTLTATRTVNSLRYTGGALALSLGTSNYNLESYGVLNGGSGLLTIQNGTGGTGALTTPTGGGNLYLTTGNNNITVSAPIKDNGGAATLVKSGSGTLTLSSNTSDYSGGTVLHAGTIAFGANNDSYLGATSGGLIFNGGQISYTDDFTLNANRTVTVNGIWPLTNRIFVNGVLSGNGPITQSGSDGATFANTGNTFTGPITVDYAMTFASLGDSSNPYNFQDTSAGFTWTGGAKTFALRPFTFSTTGNGQIRSSGTGALVIQQDLAITGTAGARTLFLGGTYTTSANTFAGSIANGTGSTVSLTKEGDNSIWALSGTNTYTGATTLTAGGNNNDLGFLIFRGMQALPLTTTLNIAQTGSNQDWGTIRLLDDSATPTSRSGVHLYFSNTENVATTDNRYWMRAFVGNNSTANIGTSSSMQTGSTIQLGNLNVTEGNTASTGGGLWLSGANGYRLQIADVNVTLQAGTAVNHQATLRADNPMTVTGTVRQSNDAAVGSTTTLQVEGSAAGSLISGNIQNSAGGRAMNVSKAGTGEWKLSGDNTYSGVTTVSGGVLVLNHATALPGGIGSSGGTSALTFNGGVLGLGVGDFTRDLGTAGTVTAVNFTGAGGWAAYVADRLVNLNNDSHQIVWATANTGFNGQTLILGASTATHKVTLQNGLDLGTAVRSVQVDDGSATVDAELSGVIAGAGGGLTKTGTGTLLLSAPNSSYSGVTTISAGTLAVGKLDNGNSPSSIGQSSNADTSLVINNGGALRYVGSGDSTDRLFRFGTAGAGAITFDASGSGAVNVSNTGSPTFNGSQPRTLNLIGSNTGNNTLAALLPSAGSTLSVFKDGAGTWAITSANTYTGTTAINGGTLQIGAGGATGALPTGSAISIASGATLAFNRNNTLTQGTHFSTAAITGAGGVKQAGSGTTVLNAANSYTGPTTVSAGVLSATTLADGGANSAIGASANAAANLVLNGGTLRYTGAAASTDRAFTLGTAGGTFEASGSGALTLASTTAPTLSGTDTTRTLTLGGSSTAGNVLAAAVGDNGTGATSLTKADAGKWVLTGDHGFTGNTTINGGTLQLGSGGTSGSLDPAGDISVASGAVLVVNRSDTVTQGTDFSTAAISGDGGFTQAGSGTTVLTAVNTYTGPTTVSAGELRVNGALAVGSAVAVNGGSLRGNGTVGGTVTVGAAGSVAPGTASIDSLTVSNLNVSAMANGGTGKLVYRLGAHPSCDQIDVTGTLTIGTGLLGLEDLSFTDAGGLQAGTYTLITSGGISGTLAATTNGFVGTFPVELQKSGDDIVLVVTSAAAQPVVAGVTSPKTNGVYTVDEEIDIEVTFNMPVVVSGSPYLTMETGATDRNATFVGGSGTDTLTFRYTVQDDDTSDDLDYNGTTALKPNGGSIKDEDEVEDADLTLVEPGSLGSISFAKAIEIDTTAATVAGVSATTADDSYKADDVIAITVTFDEPVWVAGGTPSLALSTGGSATYSSGSGTATLTFEYTVQAGHTASDLDYSSDSALALNSATIRDLPGNNAVLTLATPGDTGSLGDSKNIVIDTTAPTVSSIADSNGGGAINVGASLTYTITFDEAMDAATVDAADFDSAGTALFNVTGITPQSSTEFDVAIATVKGGSLILRIKTSAVITDIAGNALAVPVQDDTSIVVNTVTLTWDDNLATTGAQDGPDAWLGANKWWNGSGNEDWGAGNNAVFGNNGTAGAVTLASPTTINSITFNSFSGTYTLGTAGQAITLYDGITKNAGSGAATISSPVTLGGAQTWVNHDGDALTVSAAVDNGGNLLTVDGAGPSTFGAVTISGSGGLTKNGTGNLNLNGTTVSISGDLVINGGEVLTGSMSIGSGNLTLNGGVLEDYWSGNLTRTLGPSAGQVQIPGGASGLSGQGTSGLTVKFNNNAAYEVVWGSSYFNPSTLVLQGPWANEGGNVNFQNKLDLNGATRTIAVNRNPGATTGNATISGVVRNSTGTAGLTKTGPGKLILSVAPTFNGDTTVSEGTLQLNAANTGNQSAAVRIAASGAKLVLNFNGTDTVYTLFIGSKQYPLGVYGHSSTGATNAGLGVGALDAYFGTGNGKLAVTFDLYGAVFMLR